MGRHPLRRLVVGDRRYLWRVVHEHDEAADASGAEEPRPRRCREVLRVQREGDGGRGLRLEFTDGPGRHAGYPQAGVVWRDDRVEANLNQPGVVRAAIELALTRGWDPARAAQILDGWPLLDELVARIPPQAAR